MKLVLIYHKKNDNLHFYNKEHEMQWKCKFSS